MAGITTRRPPSRCVAQAKTSSPAQNLSDLLGGIVKTLGPARLRPLVEHLQVGSVLGSFDESAVDEGGASSGVSPGGWHREARRRGAQWPVDSISTVRARMGCNRLRSSSRCTG